MLSLILHAGAFMLSLTHTISSSIACSAQLAAQRPSRRCSEPLRCEGLRRHESAGAHWPRSQRMLVAARADTDGDPLDFAVLRFTLGIPGFDDALLPRVIGVLGLVLLVLNSVLSDSISGAEQVRAELLGSVLGILCISVPTLNARLQDAAPGRGRKAASAQLASTSQVFTFANGTSDDQQRELAWASFVLLRNINVAGVAVKCGDRLLMVRGAISSKSTSSGSDIVSLSQEMPRLRKQAPSQYLPDRASVSEAQASGGFVPASAESLAIQSVRGEHSGRDVTLIVWSGSPRALPQRDRVWITSIARKLAQQF